MNVLPACTGLTCSGKTAWESTGTARGARLTSAARIGLGGRGVDVVAVETDLIVDFSFLGIAQDLVGFRDRFEFFFRSLVAGIDIWVIFARKFAEGFADVLGRSRLFY